MYNYVRFIVGLFNLRGIYLPIKKTTSGVEISTVNAIDFCNVPLKLKGIAESEPVVHVGDEVKQGTLIASPSGKFGINIYSPICGKVLNVFERMNSYGEICKHILIMNDEREESETLPEMEFVNDASLVERLKDAGVIDTISKMPAYLKYAFVGARSYRTVLIMMDSTDPNNTINQTLAEQKMEEVVNGAKYFMNMTSAQYVTFVFTEANYKLATKLKKHIQETKKNYDFRIKFIPNRYPYDNPYMVAKKVCKKKITAKNSFLDAGITIESAEACYDFCKAVEFGRPVTSKVITVDGDNVVRKGNYIVPNGTSYEKLLNFVGVEDEKEAVRLIDGNILSGEAQYNKEISISLMTNTIVLNKYDVLESKKEYPCISCGKCTAVCPAKLNPTLIEEYYLSEKYDMVYKLNVHSCMECGCCSYVCPAKRFLTQRIKAAKFYDKKNRGAK